MPELMISIPLAKLKPSPTNPRKHLGDPAKIAEMALSMKEHGVLEPVIARQAPRGDSYELVCGHRRLAAAKQAELEGIPAIVRELTDDQVLDIQIIENGHREDVHPLDEADAFAQAVERGRTPTELAERIGRPVTFVVLRMQLMKLCKEARKALDAGELTLAVAQMLARIPDPKLQAEALEEVGGNEWGEPPMKADDARKRIEERFMLRLGEAPFDIADAKLVPKAGACPACPKRTGAQRELFADIKSPDLCTDPSCFKSKKDALFQIRAKEAKAGGQAVLDGQAAEKALRQGGYRKLTDHEWVGQKRKTIRELVAKAKPPVTLARGKDGEVYELVRDADVARCLPKERAQKADTSVEKYKQAQKQREAKEKRRKKAVRLAIDAAVIKAGKLAPADLLELLVRAFAARAWNEVQKAILDRRGVDTRGGNIEKRLLKLIKDAATNDEVQGFAMELALGTGQLGYGSNNEVWRDGMQLVGLDLAEFERQVAAEAKAKAKAKQKPVPKEKAAAKTATAKKRKAKR